MTKIQDVSPTSASGRMFSLAVSQDGQVVYAGSWSNIWSSVDGGQNFDQVTWPQPPPGWPAVPGSIGGWAVFDLAVSPVDSNVVVALTRYDRARSDRGIWRSTDGGNNFVRVHRFPGADTGFVGASAAGQVVWAPGSPNLVYAAGGTSVAISSDAGATFTDVLPGGRAWGLGSPQAVYHLAVSFAPPNGGAPVVYALGNGHIWFSADGGASWVHDDGSVPPSGGATTTGLGDAPSVMVVSPASPLMVYLVAWDGTLWLGDYTNFAATHQAIWTQVPAPLPADQDSGNRFLAVTRPGGPDLLFYYAQRYKVYVGPLAPTSATDWHSLEGIAASKVHVDLHGLFLSADFDATLDQQGYQVRAGTLWLLSDGGIYRSTDGGKHFQRASGLHTLSVVNFAAVAFFGAGPALSLNTGDNDGFYSMDGGAHWSPQDYSAGDNDCSFADPLRPPSMLVFTPRWNSSGVLGPASEGGTVTIYESSFPFPPILPNAGQGTSQRHIVPGPPHAPGRESWNASSFYGMRGFRPIVLNLPGDDFIATPSDYVFIRFKTDTQAVLLRTRNILDIDSPNDWETLATTPYEGARVFQQGPVLPSPNAGVVQASGGHASTVFYVGGDIAHQLWKWTNGMGGWQRVVPGGGATTAIRFFVDPYRPNIIYLLDSDHVKRSENGGLTWVADTELEQQLTSFGQIPVDRVEANGEADNAVDTVLSDMQFDPFDGVTRFAVGEAGAFFTVDGVHWNRLLDTAAFPGRPTNCYYDWVSNSCERALYVAFAGRSIVKLSPLPWGSVQAPDPQVWTPQAVIPMKFSKATPAITVFNGRIHMIYLDDTSNDLARSISTDGFNWDPSPHIPGHKSKATPALAVYGSRIHMVHLDDTSNNLVWSSSPDGFNWDPPIGLIGPHGAFKSRTAPALAAYGTYLYLVYLDDSSSDIWWSRFDGTTWRAPTKIAGQLSTAAPVLAVVGSKLHMVHLGDNTHDIWWSVFDGGWWSNTRIRCQLSKASPALAAHNNILHMVHLGDNSNELWWSIYDDRVSTPAWTPNVLIPNQLSKASPALSSTPDGSALVMLHLGVETDHFWPSNGLRFSSA